jgi:uncharacterized protein (TIGR02391 family)
MESVPPTIQPHQAIPLLLRQIERLEGIIKLQYNDPAVNAWVSTTENILNGVFGKPNGQLHHNTDEFKHAHLIGVRLHHRVNEAECQRNHVVRQKNRKALLEAFIEQLQDLAPPAAASAADLYVFHSEIERVSGQLYRDRHYKQAALEAYIRVIDEVKVKSGLGLDGDSLMNNAFGCDNRTPIIQFNNLQTEAERDEQKALMFFFKGIVGLRNSKAHSNQLFNDPHRAHEYLALASLLMRLLEIAVVNPPPSHH